MKKKLTLFCLFAAFLVFPCYAGNKLVDNAGILSAREKESAAAVLEKISSLYNFDLVIVTEENTGGKSPMEFAGDFFDYNGYGLGPDRDGCLFLQVTGSRDYWFSTSGRGIRLLNSSALNRLKADVVKRLSSGDHGGAYMAFAAAWEEFLSLETKGRNYNFFERWNVILIPAAWLAALLIGFIITGVWKSKMNTALPKTEASSYEVEGSLVITKEEDRFIYSTLAKTRRQSQSSSGPGGTHTSSSGRSHGGGGGRY